MTALPSLLRARDHHSHVKVTMVELFFDLVFVFAVTQLSHTLIAHLTLGGAARTLLLFLAVWWVWIYTSWVTNWLDPERTPVRLMLFALMLGGLLLSSSLAEAFGATGLRFGIGFAAMQVGRSLFAVYALRNQGSARVRNFVRITIWLTCSGVLWVVGGVLDGDARVGCWIGALAIEYLGPAAFFRVPGLGASTAEDWDIDGAHMAERCALFVIIALGESILVTGATFADLPADRDHIAAFLIAFTSSIAMWWIYFDSGHERAAERIVHAADPGRQARMAYTYLHLPIIGGIIVGAVSDEIILKHPGHLDGTATAIILGAPALYLLGNALFKWVSNDRRTPPLSHLVGLGLLGALVPVALAHAVSALVLAGLATGCLIVVATWETRALRGQPRPETGTTTTPPHEVAVEA